MLLACAGLQGQEKAELIYPPWEAVIEAAADLYTLPEHDRCNYRYFDIGNVADSVKKTFLSTFSGHIHFISREPDITPPVLIGKRLLRVNILDYRWGKELFEKLDKTNVYFRVRRFDPNTQASVLLFAPWLTVDARAKKALEDLQRWTQSNVPLYNARKFLQQTATSFNRSPGYYDFLGGVKSYKDVHKLAGYDATINKERKGTLRAVVLHSGISNEPRGVAIQEASGGWFTYTIDFKLAVGVKNPIRNQTADIERRADAFEMIFHLSNKFLGTALFNDKEETQNDAPAFVGYNSRALGRIGAIRSGIDCWSCHTNGGFITPKDHTRYYLGEGNVASFYPKDKFKHYEEYKTFVREFIRKFEPSLDAARVLFEGAVKEATGVDSKTFLPNYTALFYEVEHKPVQLAQAARDVGCTPKALYRSLARAGNKRSLEPILLPLLEVNDAKVEGIPPRQWEEMLPIVHEYLVRFP